MRFLMACMLLAALLPLSQAAMAQGPSPDHPLLGIWRFDILDLQCAEVYEFRADGTRRYSSGDEAGESRYQVSATVSDDGFFMVRDTITQTNGRDGCAGAATPVGDIATIYVRFHPLSNDRLIMCRSPDMDNCFGPFVRSTGSR